jgi:hypothetical protein
LRSLILVLVMVLFCCSEREYQRGDEIAWYADGDKIVRNEFNPATAYAFGILIFFFFLHSFFFCGVYVRD